ncbi:MAG: hypothetical protein IID51_05120 [Proteobacteria bacterium]|nr:hypothetical protein [Pseudomonadota bacterium]
MSARINIAIKPRMEQLAALLILAVIVSGVFWATFGTAYSSFADQRAKAARVQNILNRLESVIERQNKLADYFATGSDADRLDVIFLDAPQPGIGTARLQEQIGSLASASGMEIRRVSAVSSGASNRISLQIQATGSVVTFSSFLVGLEQSQPWLFVDSMNVSQSFRRRGRDGKRADPALTALLTISAYTGPDDSPATGQGGAK